MSPATMVVREGRIERVAAGHEIPEGLAVVDLSDRVLIPGLVDGHTHLGLRGIPLTPATNEFNEGIQPFTPYLRIEDSVDPDHPAFRAALEHGTTTAGVIPGSSNLVGGSGLVFKTHGTSLEARVLQTPRILKLALGMNPKSAYGSRSRSPKTRMAVASMLRNKLEEARLYREARANDPDTPLDQVLEPLAQALDGGMQLHIHAARADDVLTAVRLVQEFGLRATIGHAYEGYLIADALAEAAIPVFLGPKLDGWFRGTAAERPVDVAGAMHTAGVTVSIMTDGYVDDLLMHAAYAVRLGLDPESALRAVTIHPAEALGVADRVGTLTPGRDADFVVLDGQPFATGTRVLQVWVQGRLAYDAEGRTDD